MSGAGGGVADATAPSNHTELELGAVDTARDSYPLVNAAEFAGGYSDGVLVGSRRRSIGSVLSDYWDRWRSSPLLFWSSIGALVTMALLIAGWVEWGTHNTAPLQKCNTGRGITGDTTAPEGSISASFEAQYDYRGRPRAVVAKQGVVAADHGRCSDIGLGVLQEGGNAVDAAIASALCQGVLNPMASGLGGGHFLLIRLPNGTAEVIDAREVAPAAANQTMFVGNPELSREGGLAVAVPLELRGFWLAHQRHGKLDWSRLVEPSIDLAERGFPAHPYLVAALEAQNFTKWVAELPLMRDTFFVLGASGWRLPKVNETCCARPSLAKLLRDVAASGPDVLYSGKYAAPLAAEVVARGGILTADDLKDAQAVVRQPLRAQAMGLDLVAAPPPSSAATVLSALLVLGGFELPLGGAGPLGVHRLVESMKHAFALRTHLGDPGPPAGAAGAQQLQPFVNLTGVLADMLSPNFTATLRASILDNGVLNTTQYGGSWGVDTGGLPPEDHGTSHMSVVDSDKMAVSLTSTVNSGFGSKVFSKSTGLVLNNQMDDFSSPGAPNQFGLPPSPANFIRPGKRPLSSMSPVIVEQGGELRAVLGASGGPRIISAVLQTLVRVVAYGEDLFSAVANPRLHHQLVPPALFAEDWAAGGVEFVYSSATLEALRRRGHQVNATDWGAVTQAVAVSPEDGSLRGVSDPRKDGAPAGY